VTLESTLIFLLALAVEALRWAIAVGAFLLVLYWLVRFVKWAWTEKPREKQYEPTDAEKGAANAVALLETGGPLTNDQWGTVLDAISGHDNTGRPICLKCGFVIPEGKEVLLTDDEKAALTRGRPDGFLPEAFRHMNEADCRAGGNR